ncbi:MAG: bifunctional helix-turn-helix domain-containing protein/methylated-DNA--[protein]-cysteine S-methyltransferase [Planktomarina sp.]
MQEDTYHYKLIKRAIDAIDNADHTLSLDELSQAMNLSPSHFQRLFTAWVGVSPKKYQQYLHLDHAKHLLQNNFTTFETAQNIGLSGTSRLHDLFITWEAMTPGVYAKKGAGLTIDWGWFPSPFGPALVMGTPSGICGLAFSAEMGEAHAFADMTARWPKAVFQENPSALNADVQALFERNGQAKLSLIGTSLQIKVWEALLNIPTGSVSTYSEIAKRVGNPKAVRAVGTAIGRNPISWIIPCHRALRKSGALGGYHWGLPVKRALLAYEAAQAEAR